MIRNITFIENISRIMKNKGEIVDLYSLIIAKFLSDDEKKFTGKKNTIL